MFGLGTDKKFTFVNWGGSYQLNIERAEDLTHLDELDDPFWMATSAPIYQLRADPVALALLDVNQNERIISSEIRRTCRWLFRVLKNVDAVSARQDVVQLAHIRETEADGQALLTTARRVLTNLDRPDDASISLRDIRSSEKILAKEALNGDGVIPPKSVEDEDLQGFLTDVLKALGETEAVAGTGGVDRKTLDAFDKQAREFLDWQRQVSDASGEARDALLPLGDDTAAAYALFAKIRPKLDEYFGLCELVQINETLGRTTTQPEQAAAVFESQEARTRYLDAAPLGPPNAAASLRFDATLNPRYRAQVFSLRDTVVQAVLRNHASSDVLTREHWDTVRKAFTAYEAWLSKKTGAQVEALGTETLTHYVESNLRARTIEIIDRDLKVGKELAALKQLERLALMQRWFLDICNNFIAFRDMYNLEKRAMFEFGRLVIDGRIFNFNVRVNDMKQHSAAAKACGMFLLYSEVTASPGDEVFHIVTPVTSRDRGTLGRNKRGVIFDYRGKQWDTRVVEVVENPISLTEAICAPFKKISQMISDAVEKLSASTEKQLESSMQESTGALEKGVVQGMTTPVTPAAGAAAAAATQSPAANTPDANAGVKARDMMMTGGIAFAALGSSFAFIAKTFADLDGEKALAAVGIGLAVVMVPVVIVALLKLRARNLSSILEASGWAINGRMRLTHSLARMLAPDPVHPQSFTKVSEDLVKKAVRDNPLAAAFKGEGSNADDEPT